MGKYARLIAVILSIVAIVVILYFERAEINHGKGTVSNASGTVQTETVR